MIEGVDKWLRGEDPDEAKPTDTTDKSPVDEAMSANMEAINKLEEWQSMMEAQK